MAKTKGKGGRPAMPDDVRQDAKIELRVRHGVKATFERLGGKAWFLKRIAEWEKRTARPAQ